MKDLTKLSAAGLESVTKAARTDYDAAHSAESEARVLANAARREVSRLARVRYDKGRFWDKCRNEQTRRSNILDNIAR